MDITIGKILSWVFGAALILNGVAQVTQTIVGGILIALVGVFLLPPARQKISEEYDIQFSRWVVVVIALAGFGLNMAFLPSSLGDTTTTPDIDQPTSPSETPEDEGSTVQQRTHQVGEAFTVGNIQYEVTGVATRNAVGGQFTQTEADGVFLLVDIEITNEAKESVFISNSHLNLVDSQEREYPVDTDPMIYADNTFSFERLDPGVANEGIVIFDVPEDQSGRILRVSPVDTFSTEEPHFVTLG